MAMLHRQQTLLEAIQKRMIVLPFFLISSVV